MNQFEKHTGLRKEDYEAKSGVYKITNKVTGKCYIGSSFEVYQRFVNHWYCLQHNKHTNNYLQNSWNKHGYTNFSFELLEECDECIMFDRERWWIEGLNTTNPKIGYNVEIPYDRSKRISEESKLKISISLKEYYKNNPVSEETKECRRISRMGYKPTKEQIEKAANARRGKKRSAEFCKQAAIYRSLPVVILTPDGTFVKGFSSSTECGKFLNRSGTSVRRARYRNTSTRFCNGHVVLLEKDYLSGNYTLPEQPTLK